MPSCFFFETMLQDKLVVSAEYGRYSVTSVFILKALGLHFIFSSSG